MKLIARTNHDQRFSLLVHGASGPVIVDRGRGRERDQNTNTRSIVHKPGSRGREHYCYQSRIGTVGKGALYHPSR